MSYQVAARDLLRNTLLDAVGELMDERGWSDDVIEKLLEAIRSSAPGEVDEVVHRILKEMR